MKKLCFAFATIVYLFATIYSAIAQNDSVNIYSLSIEELMKLEVEVASFVQTDLKKQPVSFTTISHEQLLLSGARTLADALSMFVPGLFMVEDQDDVIVGFRGLAPDNNSKLLILVNGQNLNIEWFWGPPPALLNTTHFQFIEKVEVIRDPGSVTLGQGALLGVINIVTSSGKLKSQLYSSSFSGSANAFLGMNDFWGVQADVGFYDESSSGYFYMGKNEYAGQMLRNEGWANDKANEGYKGGNVIDIGTKLKRSSNTSLIGNYAIKKFGLELIVIDHKQDLYNFYRDRNIFGETLISFTPSFQHNFNENVKLNASINATIDNFLLESVDGYTMGGSRENRYGGKLVLNVNELFPRNRLAVGTEF
ncbi:MAG TPA: TonB-dependent receptor plug domain-containing protein [Tenuifilaceae bacterium]|nr:TonB-dependent receptor plug domain-containing protein [Tenuifilaceae bacterium]